MADQTQEKTPREEAVEALHAAVISSAKVIKEFIDANPRSAMDTRVTAALGTLEHAPALLEALKVD